MLTLETVTALLTGLLAFPLTLALTRFLMSYNSAKGVYGVDVHKVDKPRIPEMCGASIPVVLIGLAFLDVLFHPEHLVKIIAFASVVGATGLVGALDDRLGMRGRYKPALALLCGLPIVALGAYGAYDPTLKVPIFGGFHLPLIYPLAIPVAISVTTNAANMLDPLNGTLAGGVAIMCSGLLIGLLVSNADSLPVFLSASLLFSCLGFFYYNKYPSRAFSGNVGQLAIGGALGSMAILGKIEIATIVAMFPHIQNSFFFLSRIKRFAEHKEIAAKPTRLQSDGKLASTGNPQAPLTLVRTMLVGRPAPERDVVSGIFSLFMLSSLLALTTILLTR